MKVLKAWEKRSDEHRVCYAVLTDEGLRLGETIDDDRHQDTAGEISIEQFLRGGYQRELAAAFGEDVLGEAIALARGIPRG